MNFNSFDQGADRSHDHSLKYHAGILEQDDSILPMWIADMDFATPECVRNALVERAQFGVFGYTAPWDEYVDAVLGWMKRRHHVELDADWLVTCPGIVPGLKIIIQALTKENDEILILPPVYHPFHACVKDLGRTLVQSPLIEENGKYSINFDHMEETLKTHDVKMLIFCSPHNPTGNIWAKEDLQRVCALCRKYNVILVSDEIHMDFDPEKKHTNMLAADPEIKDLLVLCTAPSKTFNMPGLQTSNLFIPDPAKREAIEKMMDRCGMGEPNVLGLTACQAAYEKGDEWVDALNAYTRANQEYGKKFFDEHVPEITMEIPEGTYLFWMDCRKLGLNDDELQKFFMSEAKLWLDEVVKFGVEGSGYMRLNAACPRKTLTTALERIEAAVKARRENAA